MPSHVLEACWKLETETNYTLECEKKRNCPFLTRINSSNDSKLIKMKNGKINSNLKSGKFKIRNTSLKICKADSEHKNNQHKNPTLIQSPKISTTEEFPMKQSIW